MRRLAFVTPFSSVHRCFFVDVRFIEDSLPSCATRFKQFCWISGTKPGVENRLHVAIGQRDKEQLGRLLRYAARPVVSLEALVPVAGRPAGLTPWCDYSHAEVAINCSADG